MHNHSPLTNPILTAAQTGIKVVVRSDRLQPVESSGTCELSGGRLKPVTTNWLGIALELGEQPVDLADLDLGP